MISTLRRSRSTNNAGTFGQPADQCIVTIETAERHGGAPRTPPLCVVTHHKRPTAVRFEDRLGRHAGIACRRRKCARIDPRGGHHPAPQRVSRRQGYFDFDRAALRASLLSDPGHATGQSAGAECFGLYRCRAPQSNAGDIAVGDGEPQDKRAGVVRYRDNGLSRLDHFATLSRACQHDTRKR